MMAQTIGYFVPQFPGQTHSFFWREIIAFEAKGADVSLISTRSPGNRLAPHRWAAQAQARTTYLAPPSISDVARAPALLWRAARCDRTLFHGRSARHVAQIAAAAPFAAALRRVTAAAGVDHLHVGSAGFTALITALCRLAGGPRYSMTLHNPLAVFGPMQDLKWRHAVFGAAITPALRDEMRRELGADAPETLLVQAMGVDVDRFRRTEPYRPWRPGQTLALFSCARLNPAKGHDDAAKVVARLRAAGVDARLRIAGEDDDGGTGYRPRLEAEIARLGLGDAVTLLGAIDEETVIAEQNRAHFFVLASHAEPLGVAYMEAMSCETPTIGTQAGGVPELISHGVNGWMAPPRDPDAMAALIRKLLEDGETAAAVGAQGRRAVIERFRASIGAERLLEQIEAIGGA